MKNQYTDAFADIFGSIPGMENLGNDPEVLKERYKQVVKDNSDLTKRVEALRKDNQFLNQENARLAVMVALLESHVARITRQLRAASQVLHYFGL